VTADSDTATDTDLWDRLLGGDREALAVLFDRHGNAVYNFAFRRTASWTLAEEVVQATFLTTWRRARDRRLPPLDHTTALPWLLGVVARSRSRSSGRHEFVPAKGSPRSREESRRPARGLLVEPASPYRALRPRTGRPR
jgi:DNA-directed RNA polymerase specialized sigma24 family protein